MQQQTMNPAPSAPLNLISTEKIQKCLNENKDLIMEIHDSQNNGKGAECARLYDILQKNLTFLAAVADAQDAQTSGSPASSKPPTNSDVLKGESQALKLQFSQMRQQQPVAKFPFQMNGLQPQDQQHQHQLMQFKQQQQPPINVERSNLGGSSGNNGLHFLMQPGPGGRRAMCTLFCVACSNVDTAVMSGA